MITKVKFDGSKVRIEYKRERKDGGEPDEHAIQSSDKPSPEFTKAMDALAADVVTICQLTDSDINKLTVRAVTFTHTNNIMGACITALKALDTCRAPLVLNTPHLPSVPYSDAADEPTLSDDTTGRLQEVIARAEAYIAGERAQGDLLKAA